mmetsp:Transcript_4456/g.5165  ORF Transcript_4456/g.5165 Transcript_4456/m.5165 type:complete len:340 (-) Transcript_4456:30-1049(-)
MSSNRKRSNNRLSGIEFKPISAIKDDLFKGKDEHPRNLTIIPETEIVHNIIEQIDGQKKYNESNSSESITTKYFKKEIKSIKNQNAQSKSCNSINNRVKRKTTTLCCSDVERVQFKSKPICSISDRKSSSNSDLRTKPNNRKRLGNLQRLLQRSHLAWVEEMSWAVAMPQIRRGQYTGEVNDGGIPHGYGILFFENGDKYEGSFLQGEMHGEYSIFGESDGSLYFGGFSHNLRNGYGEYIMHTARRRYLGYFGYGRQHGKGTQYFFNGSLDYRGEWYFGQPKLDINICKFLDDLFVGEITNFVRALDMEHKRVEGKLFKFVRGEITETNEIMMECLETA